MFRDSDGTLNLDSIFFFGGIILAILFGVSR